MPNYIDVQPELLRWAIERSGLPLERYGKSVSEWLSGDKRPTFNQLQKFAKKAMVPFGYLFLRQPPDEILPVPDYRTRREGGVPKPSPNLIETIFEMQRRQDWMREYLLEEGHEALPFVGSAKAGDEIVPLARQMRKSLRLSENWAERQDNWEAAVRFLRKKIEDAGILIFIAGTVGTNTHRTLYPEEFQGFVLVDDIAPLIFVNGADYRVAQMFTIAHELAHVWIGQSALFELDATNSPDLGTEKYCNAVAAEFLIPKESLERSWQSNSDANQQFEGLARVFKVSPIVVARRAKDLRMVTNAEFFDFYRRYMARERKKRDEP